MDHSRRRTWVRSRISAHGYPKMDGSSSTANRPIECNGSLLTFYSTRSAIFVGARYQCPRVSSLVTRSALTLCHGGERIRLGVGFAAACILRILACIVNLSKAIAPWLVSYLPCPQTFKVSFRKLWQPVGARHVQRTRESPIISILASTLAPGWALLLSDMSVRFQLRVTPVV